MKKDITIKSNDAKIFFRQYIELISPILNLNKRKRTLDVLALLLYYNYKYIEIKDYKVRCKLVFDYDTRIEIQTELGMSTSVLNNCLTELRKKRLITKENIILESLLIVPEESNVISFNLVLNENKEKSAESDSPDA